MCGIFCACTLESQKHQLLPLFESIKPILHRRGPDYQGYEIVHNSDHTLFFGASVLWMQGKNLTKQPVTDDQSVFLYNGDIFGGVYKPDGDTAVFHDTLKKCVDINILSKIQGPYAFIYFDKLKSKLYFCRDLYGRRSLLVGFKDQMLILSSVAKRSLFCCIEVPAIGIFVYDLKSKDLCLIPWEFRHFNFFEKVAELERHLNKPVSLLGNSIKEIKCSTPTDSTVVFLEQLSCNKNNVFEKILENPNWLQNIRRLKMLLEKAIEVRVKAQLSCCRNCYGTTNTCSHCTVGVLFSGGIDCTILTLLLDQYIDKNRPIDLLNVAFGTKVPDRQTGMQSFEELKRLRPNRNWNFMELNVEQDELNEKREQFVADLIYPLNTILDDSLGCALWFASRGQTDSYTSSCRVLVTGMGADELFGGYTKHRNSFKRLGWKGLHQSLEEDWQNISFRNLARDDRVISDHGRQLRTPYLDEDVVQFVRNLSCLERTYPSDCLPQGVGDKILLRSLGYYLGLKEAATYKKRALQFGSRIANSKEKAYEVSPRL
ncbi:hypothetical protein RN001_000237 [Aquatica leii]|uniref:Glutamine amidotransferase type-2 domain-containing protein n=1 Tax=Aquatica leii TaxID=1421715 RepID=A0AAN7SC44_9COLE|nr:hypothetical protein RN001_000237 [Aquatica leii]